MVYSSKANHVYEPKQISRWIFEIHEYAREKGWWDNDRQIPELLCLLHSEISEALEAYRKSDDDNFREELADLAIRLLDICGAMTIDLEAEIDKKHKINLQRPYRHGNKKC